jgi:hypothetical protein
MEHIAKKLAETILAKDRQEEMHVRINPKPPGLIDQILCFSFTAETDIAARSSIWST